MADTQIRQGESSVVASGSATSGLNVNLHPLPILNISDHCTRTRLTAPGSKVIGALLGTQVNRDLSIINSFELILTVPDEADQSGAVSTEDVNMDGSSGTVTATGGSGRHRMDAEFLETRKEQFKLVFPTLDVVGWYSIGEAPSADDIDLHAQIAATTEAPIFLLFDPSSTSSSGQELPFKVYESALAEGSGAAGEDAKGKFVQLEYGVETGEAERIAVDGVTRGGMEGDGESAVVSNLTTQRNAIKMLLDRVAVITQYISDVADKKTEPDHNLLRQIASLVASLPTIDAADFKRELQTEFEDVQLTQYLSDITKQLSALDEYSEKHHHMYPDRNEREAAFGAPGFIQKGRFEGGFGGGVFGGKGPRGRRH